MNNKFGEFLYSLRKEKGWTQSELADKLDLTNKAVSKWETGDSFPETSLLVPLASLFNVSVDELLRGERKSEGENTPIIIEPEKEKLLKPLTKKQVTVISLAIALILFGVMMLVILEINDYRFTFYVPQMLFCTSVAIFMLVSTGMLRALGSAELDEESQKKGKKAIYMLSLGISLLILSPMILIMLSEFGLHEQITIPVFFSFVLVGVPLIVYNSMVWEALKKEKKIPTEEAPALKPNYKVLEDVICGIVMLVCTGIFLLLGFLRFLWHPGWVVFPIGGILCAIVSTILKGISSGK